MSAPSASRILIVEDDLDLLEVLRFVLEEEGYRVSTGKRGADALSVAVSEDVSLVLLDISMPDIDGIEVAKRLRADARTANVRIAIHTGSTPASVRERFTHYDAFIGKADDALELLAAVKAALEQPTRAVSPAASES